METIKVDGETFNADYFRKVTDKQAVKALQGSYEYSTIMKAWKVANGFSVPNEKKTKKSNDSEN